MFTTITSRDRVAHMFKRREHDHVPRHDTFWPVARWRCEGIDGDTEAALRGSAAVSTILAGSSRCSTTCLSRASGGVPAAAAGAPAKVDRTFTELQMEFV
ncbi:MAG: hypothetical protein CMJ18_05710 [Phycisphaeraceae bacterium]|jgi:hypothetical protein|nr:hypothetical protein [Phycisphaeraceae bacterium]